MSTFEQQPIRTSQQSSNLFDEHIDNPQHVYLYTTAVINEYYDDCMDTHGNEWGIPLVSSKQWTREQLTQPLTKLYQLYYQNQQKQEKMWDRWENHPTMPYHQWQEIQNQQKQPTTLQQTYKKTLNQILKQYQLQPYKTTQARWRDITQWEDPNIQLQELAIAVEKERETFGHAQQPATQHYLYKQQKRHILTLQPWKTTTWETAQQKAEETYQNALKTWETHIENLGEQFKQDLKIYTTHNTRNYRQTIKPDETYQQHQQYQQIERKIKQPMAGPTYQLERFDLKPKPEKSTYQTRYEQEAGYYTIRKTTTDNIFD